MWRAHSSHSWRPNVSCTPLDPEPGTKAVNEMDLGI